MHQIDLSKIEPVNAKEIIRQNQVKVEEQSKIGRLNQHLNVYYTKLNSQPCHVQGRGQVKIESEEQPFIRHASIDESEGWVKIEMGWVQQPFMIAVTNHVGSNRQVQPDQETLQAELKQLIEIGIDVGLENPIQFTQVSPSMTTTLEVTKTKGREYFLRCASGKARITVSILPGNPII